MRTNTAKNMDVRLSTGKFARTWKTNGKEKFRVAARHDRLTTRYGMSLRKGGRFFFVGDDEEVFVRVDEERVAKTFYGG